MSRVGCVGTSKPRVSRNVHNTYDAWRLKDHIECIRVLLTIKLNSEPRSPNLFF